MNASFRTENIVNQDLMDTSGVCFGTSGARGQVVDMTNEVSFSYIPAKSCP